MVRFRYRLSWLLLLPVLLAGVISWLKPISLPFAHFTKDPFFENLYDIKPHYMKDLKVLIELRDCEYAVLMIGGMWSTDDRFLSSSILQTSSFYNKRVPFFRYLVHLDEWEKLVSNYPQFLPNYFPSIKSLGIVVVVQEGKIIATLSGPGESLTPEEYRQKIDNCLPWNYKL